MTPVEAVCSVTDTGTKVAEADDLRDVAIVLTTRELAHLWRRFGVDFVHITERAPLDEPFGEAKGDGRQPYGADAADARRGVERLYDVDRRSPARRFHENADVRALYGSLLGRPLDEVSHRLLHRTYIERSRAAAQA